MPYLAPGKLRDEVDEVAAQAPAQTPAETHEMLLEASGVWDGPAGTLNRYACQLYCRAAPQNYAAKKEWCGQILLAGIQARDTDLLAAALEIYRMDIAPYENGKAQANGDLDWPTKGGGK